MRVIILVCLSLTLLFAQYAQAHSGGTDSCGGHNDRKRGGYHVHNYSKYCACYPDSPECNKGSEPAIKEKKPTTPTSGVVPINEWNCPETQPIKGNVNVQKGTMIYHLPSGAFYTRTKPEKCYANEQDAVNDGFRESKR